MTPETDFPEQVRWLSRELGGLHCPASILARVVRHVTVSGARPMKKGQPHGQSTFGQTFKKIYKTSKDIKIYCSSIKGLETYFQ